MRFELNVDAGQTAALVVEESRPVQSQFAVANITSDQVAIWLQQRTIDASIQATLQDVLARENAIAVLESQKDARENETKDIFDDQQRLRENIKALKGTPEEKPLIERYTGQLNQQESRLETLHKESAQLNAQIDAAHDKLNDMIQKLSFDVKL
jgi:chromosome segregation ATPase